VGVKAIFVRCASAAQCLELGGDLDGEGVQLGVECHEQVVAGG